jgi:hypothetical protein
MSTEYALGSSGSLPHLYKVRVDYILLDMEADLRGACAVWSRYVANYYPMASCKWAQTHRVIPRPCRLRFPRNNFDKNILKILIFMVR